MISVTLSVQLIVLDRYFILLSISYKLIVIPISDVNKPLTFTYKLKLLVWVKSVPKYTIQSIIIWLYSLQIHLSISQFRCPLTYVHADVGEIVLIGLQLVGNRHRLYRLQTMAVSISNEGHGAGAILLRLEVPC